MGVVSHKQGQTSITVKCEQCQSDAISADETMSKEANFSASGVLVWQAESAIGIFDAAELLESNCR